MEYRDMYALFRRVPEAKQYFDGLPSRCRTSCESGPMGSNHWRI